jgi:putative FmdB family regulatory protein
MPTYDYRCDTCGTIDQKFHKMSETDVYLCSGCKCEMIKCIGRGIGVHFKGSGFYETDYKGKN